MLRYTGLWATKAFCLLCACWVVLHAAPTSPHEAREAALRDAVSGDKAQLLALYQTWKQTHSGPVEPYIALYAPDAKIYSSSQAQSRDSLLILAKSTRAAGVYDQVSDLDPPQITIKGNDAAIRAHNRYANSRDR